jgi:hypothetical protein
MKIVKLSTSPWALTQEEFNYYTPNGDGIVAEYKFEVNNDCDECDFWIVRGNIPTYYQWVKCPKSNLILLQDEVYSERVYHTNYINQFAAVVGAREVPHTRYLWHHELMPWLFVKKSYSDLLQPVDTALKTKSICVMTSDATWLDGHKTRFAFSHKLIGHFKDKLDVYGRGFRPFVCKYEILKNYKYCIALENTVFPGYFTEKLNECFLAEAYPIYYGCPDIDNYYASGSLSRIDAADFNRTIETISRVLEDDIYFDKISLIREMKIKYLQKLHFTAALSKLLNTNFNGEEKKKKVLVLNNSFYDGAQQGSRFLLNGSKILIANGIGRLAASLAWNK